MENYTPVEEIFDLFYALIKDHELARMAVSDIKELSTTYLMLAIADFTKCKKELDIVKDSYKYYVNNKLTLEEKSILAYGCCYFWLTQKVNFSKILKNQTNTKDFNNLSNASLLREMTALLEFTRKELSIKKNRYQYKNFQGLN